MLDFKFDPLNAGGSRQLGAAVRHALDLIEDRKAWYRASGIAWFHPWLLLLTDGQPSDGWQVVAAEAQRLERLKKLGGHT
jgi:uncharacterized protein YegL